jgi:hypothetical protein
MSNSIGGFPRAKNGPAQPCQSGAFRHWLSATPTKPDTNKGCRARGASRIALYGAGRVRFARKRLQFPPDFLDVSLERRQAVVRPQNETTKGRFL